MVQPLDLPTSRAGGTRLATTWGMSPSSFPPRPSRPPRSLLSPRRLAPASLLAAAGALVAACGPSDAETTLTTTRVASSLEADCVKTASTLCTRLDACSPRATRFFFVDRGECEAAVRDACRARYEGPCAAAAAPDCETPLAKSCEGLADPFALVEDPAGALLGLCALPRGTLADGAACLRDGDCRGGRCAPGDRSSHDDACGRCVTREIGATCASSPDCPAPLGCVDGICAEVRLAGEPCRADAGCRSGLCRRGACVRAGDEGAACNEDAPCALGKGLTCKDGRCAAFYIASAGEACSASLTVTPGEFGCAGGASCKDGVCAAAARIGDACGATRTCGFGQTCRSGRCERRAPSTPTCRAHDE